MSLKPAAIPLLDSGKALARGGELLIDSTSSMGLYGGGLSATGANIRNAGDCIAQAAASCRFKTGYELVVDEMREAGNCLLAAAEKMKRAAEESGIDEEASEFTQLLEAAIPPVENSGTALESTGAAILQRQPVNDIGSKLAESGKSISELSKALLNLSEKAKDGASLMQQSSQRIAFAGIKMTEAGDMLCGTPKEKPKGKSWLKGG